MILTRIFFPTCIWLVLKLVRGVRRESPEMVSTLPRERFPRWRVTMRVTMGGRVVNARGVSSHTPPAPPALCNSGKGCLHLKWDAAWSDRARGPDGPPHSCSKTQPVPTIGQTQLEPRGGLLESIFLWAGEGWCPGDVRKTQHSRAAVAEPSRNFNSDAFPHFCARDSIM